MGDRIIHPKIIWRGKAITKRFYKMMDNKIIFNSLILIILLSIIL